MVSMSVFQTEGTGSNPVIHSKDTNSNLYLYVTAIYLVMKIGVLIVWGYGEIGKHAGIRIQCREACEFESHCPYQER